MLIDLRNLQPEKQKPPKLVTDDGMTTDVREVQSEKQKAPTLVMEEGIVIE